MTDTRPSAASRLGLCMACCVLGLLAACQTPPAKTDEASAAAQKADARTVTAPPPPKEEPPPPDFGQLALQEGIDLYRRGDFAAAYKRLQESPDIASSTVDTRVEALKFSAFSACAQNKRTVCRQAFDKLLALQPAFELKDAEAKHPVWGPIFKQAKQAQARQQQQQQAPAKKK